jgi:hypothetical protein
MTATFPDNENDRSAVTDPRPWAVRGLIRAEGRVVVVAPPDRSVSSVVSQLAVCAANGIRPFRHSQGERPLRVLLFDTESPSAANRLSKSLDRLTAVARAATGAKAPLRDIWLCHGQLDLRDRASRYKLDAAIEDCQPELICIGPRSRLYSTTTAEGSETPAREVQKVFDSWQRSCGCAILVEDHAAKKGLAGTRGRLEPDGWLPWLNWADVAVTLRPTNRRCLELGYAKAPTPLDSMDWPLELRRSARWPWVAGGGTRPS